MRIAVVLAASMLVAGCSHATESSPARLTPITGARTSVPTKAPHTTTTTAALATSAPGVDATEAEAMAWVEAGPPVDAADFNVALRNGTTTSLGDDVAFTTPAGISCMTDVKRAPKGLACLVNLTDPPAQPPDVYGVWKGGWVDFDGDGVQVGSAHGDPGRFAAGQGTPLPEGKSLSFGDFRCRTDESALVCVNFARQSAVRYADAGIDPYDCKRQLPPAAGIGIQYAC